MTMNNSLTFNDVFDINKSTGALILGSNRLDDYATKFLNQHCKEALLKPMPLPVDDIIKAANLTIETASLSRDLDIFGCCLLLDGYVDVYDSETGVYTPTFYKAGTLVFDPASEWAYGEGCKRNTLIHELLHWEKDRRYFEILEIKNRKAKEQLYPIMCRQSRTNFTPANKNTKQNEVQWLEWQAHKLAPRILMPKEMFKIKTQELLARGIQSCDELVNKLSEFFIVSRASVKIRLIEVDAISLISGFADYEDVFADVNRTKEYIPLSLEDSIRLIKENIIFEEWIDSRGFIFVDGYFVLPDKKYVAVKDGEIHLTKFAKANLPLCAINIQEQHCISYKYQCSDLNNFAVLYKTEPGEIDQRIVVFSPRMQSKLQEGIDKKEAASAYLAAKDNLIPYDEETEKELLRMIGDEDKTLCNCLWFLIEKRGWSQPLDFYDYTHVHENYYGRIRDNTANKMQSDTLMAICVGLSLRFRLTEKIYGKSEAKLHYYEDPDKTRIRIMETYPGISIIDFNRLLEASNLKPLGTKERNNKN